MNNLAVISGRSNRPLVKRIMESLGEQAEQIPTIITDFANKEIFVKYKESIRGKDCYIIQSFNGDPNTDLVEALIAADTAYTSNAKRITLVLPYIYGSRQDRKSSPRTPVTISTIAKLTKAVNVDRIITVSLHSVQSSSAFFSANVRFDNLSSAKIFLPTIKKLHKEKDFIVVSPDLGGLLEARYYASKLNTDIAFADKRRPKHNKVEVLNFVGEVKDRNVVIVDDMIDTGGSLINVVNELKNQGAKDIHVFATHMILSNDAIPNLQNSSITKIYGTDSILKEDLPSKFEIFSLGDLLAGTIIRVHNDKSVGEFVEDDR